MFADLLEVLGELFAGSVELLGVLILSCVCHMRLTSTFHHMVSKRARPPTMLDLDLRKVIGLLFNP